MRTDLSRVYDNKRGYVSQMRTDEYFMKQALRQAEKAFLRDEVPVGAVIVKDGVIIARASNERQKKRVATAHAEMICIEKACKKVKDWRLDECELFVTLEPCPMCAGAALNARLKRVVFGASDLKGGAAESNFDILSSGVLNWSCEIKGGVLKDECEKIIKDFFALKRKSTKQEL